MSALDSVDDLILVGLLIVRIQLKALLAGVLGDAVGVLGPALGADALLLRLELVLLQAALQPLGVLGIVDLAVAPGEHHILSGTDNTADEPIQGQGAGNGEADPQHHQGHGPHHDLVGLGGLRILGGLLILDTVLVGDQGIVHLLHDEHGNHLITGGAQGDEQCADVGPVPCPGGSEYIKLRHGTQIDANKAKVNALQGDFADGGNGGCLVLGSG